jgi:hypothetical protein
VYRSSIPFVHSALECSGPDLEPRSREGVCPLKQEPPATVPSEGRVPLANALGHGSLIMIPVRSSACLALVGCLLSSLPGAAAPAATGTTRAATPTRSVNPTPKRKATPGRATKARATPKAATPAVERKPEPGPTGAADDPAPDAPQLERASGAAEAPVQPQTEPSTAAAVVKTSETDKGVKTYTFGAEEVEGRLRSPQILYFLRRVRAEFDPEPLGHRSFLLELSDTRRNPALW